MSLVLVVDDEPAVLEVLEEVLGDLGHEVVRAYDGLEALEVARARLPDLVVTDHMMPRLSGADLCKALRADPALRAIPAIMLSAARTAGVPEVQAFLSKPFELTEFETTVERVLRESSAKAAPRSVEAVRPSAESALREVAERVGPPVTLARAALASLRREVGRTGSDSLDVLERELGALEALRAELLDAVALSQGTLVLERERADVGALLLAAVQAYEARGEGEVSLSLPEEPVHLSVDRRRLTQLVDALLRTVGEDGAGPVTLEVTQVPGEANATLHFMRGGACREGAQPIDPMSLELFLAGALTRLHRGTLWVDATREAARPSLRVVLPRA